MIRWLPMLLMMPVGLHAQEFGNSEAGLRVAREACASCHAVEPGQNQSPRSQAPTFTRIARIPGMTTTALTVAMRTSHKTMPNIMLEPGELRDVTAYITSLHKHP
ncbi:c-type cytochrome [Microvirga mediterraneensis]|uniref:C-type cytochrome n=1 Tax=Microvirga mediterraneensis TaxID=2754695 RepID=A0A838BTC9_9HYPH|nr:c-type cytochrome [Microvirga mediterraneensis]MBA1158807.1 c-type cytochrome [Microvirga mediterraneensis]